MKAAVNDSSIEIKDDKSDEEFSLASIHVNPSLKEKALKMDRKKTKLTYYEGLYNDEKDLHEKILASFPVHSKA